MTLLPPGADPAPPGSLPGFPLRLAWFWNWIASESTHPDAFFSHERMRAPDNAVHGSPPVREFHDLADRLVAHGFTGIALSALWGERSLDTSWPDGDVTAAYRTFSEWLLDRTGIRTWLFCTWNPDAEWSGRGRAPFLCVHDPRTWHQWRDRLRLMQTAVPALGGLVVGGAGGLWQAPWDCPCDRCRAVGDRKILEHALTTLGEMLGETAAGLLWKAVSDRPSMVAAEHRLFGRLRGAVPDNVLIAHKPWYKDFRHPHPPHPLTFDGAVDGPYATEVQVHGEYRGGRHLPCAMPWRWAPVIRDAARRRERGILAILSAERGRWDHPFNGVNLAAIGRFARDPAADPDDVARDWAVAEFPRAAADVAAILPDTCDAGTAMMFARGIMTQNHSALPTINYELEPSLFGPWHSLPRCRPGAIGRGHDLSAYPSDVRAAICADPDLLLFAHRPALTNHLADTMIADKDHAVGLWGSIFDRWTGAADCVEPGIHRAIAGSLRNAMVDARLWASSFRLYLRYRSGRAGPDDIHAFLRDLRTMPSGTRLTAPDLRDRLAGEWSAVASQRFRRREMSDHGDTWTQGF